MESNLEGPLIDDPSIDGNKKDNPTTVEDDDSKIEIEVQISTTEIDNVEEEIEERSLSIDENAVTPNKEEIITTEEKVDEAMKEETPQTEENVLKELDENSSTGEKNTINDWAEKEQEIHSTDENNSEKLEDRVDSTQSLEENVDEAMQEETHCTEENVLTEHDENSSIGEKNTNNDLAEKEQDIHSTDENNSEKLENRVDSTQSIEENEKLHDRVDSTQSLEENVDEVMKEETPCTEENEKLEDRLDSPQSLEENENLQRVDSTQSLEENGVKELHKDSSMDLNEIGVEGDVPDSTKENGVSKALKRPFEEIEDQSSSEGSDDEESGDGSGSSESDNEDINKVPNVVKIKASQSKTYPSSKKRKIDCALIEINFNEAYHNPDFIKSLSRAFSGKTKMKFENGASILARPFTCCVLPNFIDSEEFINKVKTEVEEIEVESKMNDLYKFKQSVDLADFPSSEIQTIYNLLKQKCVKWLSEVTNIPLIDKIDMFCSCYTYTDHLLCHDDELEGRRIAYIYYLTPPNWEKKDGGLLDLFNTVDGEPSEVVHSFVPTCNNFIFFEVSPTSYHQVSEVLAYKTRTALSGWFYGPPLERTLHSSELVLFQSPSYCIVDIRDWVNPIYLKPDTQLHIRGSFEESSEMELMDFLQNAKYEMVCQALTEKGVSWKKIGPQNRRNYEELDDSDVPPILKECQNLFCCEPFFLVLSNLTGLRFHPLCAETEVKMGEVNSSIRKWGHGSYSLLHENSFFKFATLNAALCFNCPDWEAECGGYTSYVAKNKKDELLRVDPKPNSLALVYITKKTSFFVKYVNSLVTERSIPYFQDIFSVYREIE